MKLNLSQSGVVMNSAIEKQILAANTSLHDGRGLGSDFLGWVNLPSTTTMADLADIENTARNLASNAEVVIVVGIGGSYLGSKAVLDALSNNFDHLLKKRSTPIVIFAGQNLSEDYLYEMMGMLEYYSIACIVISKSGTTTEPAIAFRIIKEQIESRYSKAGAAERIVAITDRSRGALRTLATQEGYKTFVIEDNVGGRFSVFTPVGLLPLAVAGVDIRAFVQGARDMELATGDGVCFDHNIAAQYAACRALLYRQGKKIEILASYEPKLANIGEWWKQLYGESEGKDGKGIFPAAVSLTSDLHSMGQYIQDGERTLFETVIAVGESNHYLEVKHDAANLDGLNFLEGMRISQINKMARLGTLLAHVDGGVPNIGIEIGAIDEYSIGELLYFFEKACGMSGYALGVNPFDQPGVEAYKSNMFALLDKPGFEQQGELLRGRLK